MLNAPDVEDEGKYKSNVTPRPASQGQPNPSSPTPPASTVPGRKNIPRSTDRVITRDHGLRGPDTLSSTCARVTSPAATTSHHFGFENEGLGTSRHGRMPRRRMSSDSEGLPLTELRGLDLQSGLRTTEDNKKYPMGIGYSHHKLSDSQSSFSSYASSPSGIHSRHSSVTTIGDEHSVQTTLSEALAEETRLATVQEETSTRFLEGCSSIDSLQGRESPSYDRTGAPIGNTKGSLRRRQHSDATPNTRGRGTGRAWLSPTARYVLPYHYCSFVKLSL